MTPLMRRELPQIGHVAVVPEESGSMNVAHPLVVQKRRRPAAERRSLRCAAVRWLKPVGVKVRDNILVSLSGKPTAGLVRGLVLDEGPLDDGMGRSGTFVATAPFARARFTCSLRWCIPCT